MNRTDPVKIIDRFYPSGDLRTLLLTHSEAVARKALSIIEDLKISEIDRDFVYEAAMLHDIGIFRCDAPDIFCYGRLPYICHGVEGRQILEEIGLPHHALVCERHTGSGLTREEIISGNLPLPHREMLPITKEERLICYADKFFSKSADHPTREKTIDQILKSMERFNPDVSRRFDSLLAEFSTTCHRPVKT